MAPSGASSRWERGADGYESSALSRAALDILDGVYALTSDTAADHLARACGTDTALHEECLRLLASSGEDGPIPIDPTAVNAGLPRAGEGERFGAYTLVSPLNRGRASTIWLAERVGGAIAEDSRRVAIKLCSAENAGADGVTRFRIEAEALFQLHHPGIARVFDADAVESSAGVTTWIAMEFIEGDWITRLPAELEDGEWRVLVALVRQACEAMIHAHQRAVFHRDLKPANILIAQSAHQPGGWAIKVIDFDVARVRRSGADQTLSLGHMIVGTVQYAAPEQLRGERADARADVYGLGGVLYELLTGHPPATVRPSDDMFTQIRDALQQTPVWLGSLRPDLPASLAAVVHRALNKDRERRYASMTEFAADLDAVVAGLPVLARPPGVFEQMRAVWLARPRLAAAVLAGAAALTIGMATTSVMLGRAQRAESRLESEREELQRLVSFLTGEAVENMADIPGSLASRERMLREFEERLRPLVQGVPLPSVDPAVGRAYARVISRLADISQGTRDLEESRRSRWEALALLENVADRTPEDWGVRADCSIAMVQCGDVERAMGHDRVAAAWYGKARAVDERLLAANPAERRLVDNVMRSYIRASETARAAGRLDETMEWCERARAMVVVLEGIAPGHRLTLHARAEAENFLGILLMQAGRNAEAHEAAMRAMIPARRYLEQFPASKQALLTAGLAANIVSRTGAEGLPVAVTDDLLRFAEAHSNAARADPADAQFSWTAAQVCMSVVDTLIDAGRVSDAVAFLMRESQRNRPLAGTEASSLKRFAENAIELVHPDLGRAPGLVEFAAGVEAELAEIASRGDGLLNREARVLRGLLHGCRLGPGACDEAIAMLGERDGMKAPAKGIGWLATSWLMSSSGRNVEAIEALERARAAGATESADWLANRRWLGEMRPVGGKP